MPKRIKSLRKKRPQIRVRGCNFCKKKTLPEWKDPQELRRFLSERGRILAASRTGLCAKHQRKLTVAIKRARHLALLPFVLQVQ